MKRSPDMKKKIISFIESSSGQENIPIKNICSITDICYKTYKRWKKSNNLKDNRKGHPNLKNRLTDSEKDEIVSLCNNSEYCNLSPNQIVPKLADKEIYIASESSFYRVLRDRKLLEHRRKSKKPSKGKKPASHTATSSNQVWTWDITYLKRDVKGLFYYLYLIIDIYDRCITGFRVEENQSSKLAADMVTDAVLKRGANTSNLVLHSDNGGPMKGSTMAVTLDKLGIIKTFNRPSVSNDNSYSESLFKTLKYQLQNPLGAFQSLEEASKWAGNFVKWYNEEHLHSGIKYVTPNQRFRGEDKDILKMRANLYKKAMTKKPSRWINKITKNWNRIESVFLNKRKDQIDGQLS